MLTKIKNHLKTKYVEPLYPRGISCYVVTTGTFCRDLLAFTVILSRLAQVRLSCTNMVVRYDVNMLIGLTSVFVKSVSQELKISMWLTKLCSFWKSYEIINHGGESCAIDVCSVPLWGQPF